MFPEGISDRSRFWLSCVMPLGLKFTCSQRRLNYLSFQSFDYERT